MDAAVSTGPLLQERLLAWYSAARRDLPWRRTRDPYAILLSEIMLQQTQVERVIPKYHEFLQRFPTLADLARAARGDVIRAWAPLGYNRRAVRLHELAQQVMAHWSGRLPERVDELRRLPGLGPYTAAAVACFAFGRQIPTIDTNVRRVLTRVTADRWRRPPSPREIERLATELLPAGRAADWNQALMDLGALICAARSPRCSHCPLADFCATAKALDTEPAHRPVLRAAEARTLYRAETPFLGSPRYYRGRIIAYLRELPQGATIDLDTLGRALRVDYAPSLRGWLLGLATALARDGLLELIGADGRGSEAPRVKLP